MSDWRLMNDISGGACGLFSSRLLVYDMELVCGGFFFAGLLCREFGLSLLRWFRANVSYSVATSKSVGIPN